MRTLSVGFHALHGDANINFQLNRLVSDGTPAMLEEARVAAKRIRTLDDWTQEMQTLADTAERAGRDDDALGYVRSAEFFMDPKDPLKLATYERFIALFEKSAQGFERHVVPYEGTTLPAMRLRHDSAKHTIVLHGGFDSFVEEFFPLLEVCRDNGYDVIAFEGPGQGSVLHRQGMPMTHEWERPTSAMLDYFAVKDVTLIGISLGGYLALRAAAFEPRIARVVAYDIMYDFFDCVASRKGAVLRAVIEGILAVGAGPVLDVSVRRLMKKDPLIRWGMQQGMHVMGERSPSAFLRATKRYRTAAISARIAQDVLLLAGAEDHFVPLRQLELQRAALTSARSVTTRLFTAEEHAASHCQIGNYALALETIRDWIEAKTPAA